MMRIATQRGSNRAERTHSGARLVVSHIAGRNGIVTRTVVPRPSSLFNSNVPFNCRARARMLIKPRPSSRIAIGASDDGGCMAPRRF